MATRRLTDEEILKQIPAAIARANRARATQPHAARARYERRTHRLRVTLTNGSILLIPVALVPGLRHASPTDIATVGVSPAGVGLQWDRLDVDVSVAALARLVVGDSALLRAAGAAGGAARSPAKTLAARRNGARGGRPRRDAGKRSK